MAGETADNDEAFNRFVAAGGCLVDLSANTTPNPTDTKSTGTTASGVATTREASAIHETDEYYIPNSQDYRSYHARKFINLSRWCIACSGGGCRVCRVLYTPPSGRDLLKFWDIVDMTLFKNDLIDLLSIILSTEPKRTENTTLPICPDDLRNEAERCIRAMMAMLNERMQRAVLIIDAVDRLVDKYRAQFTISRGLVTKLKIAAMKLYMTEKITENRINISMIFSYDKSERMMKLIEPIRAKFFAGELKDMGLDTIEYL